jgi:hypothetical protein
VNLWKKIINNMSVISGTKIPFWLKVSNETMFRNDLVDIGGTYLHNYNKALFSSVWAATTEEGFESISFRYTPSPGLIKSASKNIGIDYGNLAVYYLDNTYSNFSLNLSPNFNYRVTINSFNGTTDNLSVNYTSNSVTSPILLSWKTLVDNSFWIRSSIENVKYINNQKNVLFVNDIIK